MGVCEMKKKFKPFDAYVMVNYNWVVPKAVKHTLSNNKKHCIYQLKRHLNNNPHKVAKTWEEFKKGYKCIRIKIK
jgi:hypothetical protein